MYYEYILSLSYLFSLFYGYSFPLFKLIFWGILLLGMNVNDGSPRRCQAVSLVHRGQPRTPCHWRAFRENSPGVLNRMGSAVAEPEIPNGP